MKADIFFFVSTIESVVVTVLLIIVLYYFIKAGKALHQITEALQGHMEDSEEFVAELKERLEGNFFFRLLFPPLGKKPRKEKESSR